MTFTDPAGCFEIGFPSAPTSGEKVDQAGTLVGKLITLEVKGDDFDYSLAYSDAPTGVQLVSTQVLPESVADENAERDGGKVVAVRTVTLFGLPALEYEVEATDGASRYYDINVVAGGRRYELTLIQRGDDRRDFDAFVDSFHLLQPPLAADGAFFVAAEAQCAAFAESRPPRAENETTEQHVAAIQAVVDYQQSLADTLRATHANEREQGAAAAFIDALDRSDPAGQQYVEAIRTVDPQAEQIAQSASLDLDLADKIAEDYDAPSCP